MDDLEAAYQLLRDHLDILELVQDLDVTDPYQSGPNVYANCPFHDDRTISWGIQTDPNHDRWGQYGCFSCHATGNVASLVRDLLATVTTYREAITWLLQRCGLAPTTTEEALDLAVRTRLPTGKASRKPKEPEDLAGWVRKFPAVSEDSVEWAYLKARGLTYGQIIQSGVRVGVGRYAGRVVFPILNRAGAVVSFYARATGPAEKKGLYPSVSGALSDVLWGIHGSDRLQDVCYLVEGIFDALAVERALERLGLPAVNVLAALKSSLSEGQSGLLRAWKTIVILPDGKGGSEGLIPSCKKFLPDQKLLVAEVEEGHDPDSMEPEKLDLIIQEPVSVYETQVRVFINYGLPK